MNRVIVVGGFAEARGALEPLAEAALVHYNVEDAEVFRMRDAIENPLALNHAARRQVLLTHSAGILAVAHAFNDPELLEAYSGPEPTPVHRLVLRALAKTTRHSVKAVAGPERSAHLRTLAGNAAETFVHGWANIKHLSNISKFSTTNFLLSFGPAISVRSIVMDRDEFYPPDAEAIAEAEARGLDVVQLPGFHDDLLTRPELVLSLANST